MSELDLTMKWFWTIIYIKVKYLIYKRFDNYEENNFGLMFNQGKLYSSLYADNIKSKLNYLNI